VEQNLQLSQKVDKLEEEKEREKEWPAGMLCPISLKPMAYPVVGSSGVVFDNVSIQQWLQKSRLCPITNKELDAALLWPLHQLRQDIEARKRQ